MVDEWVLTDIGTVATAGRSCRDLLGEAYYRPRRPQQPPRLRTTLFASKATISASTASCFGSFLSENMTNALTSIPLPIVVAAMGLALVFGMVRVLPAQTEASLAVENGSALRSYENLRHADRLAGDEGADMGCDARSAPAHQPGTYPSLASAKRRLVKVDLDRRQDLVRSTGRSLDRRTARPFAALAETKSAPTM